MIEVGDKIRGTLSMNSSGNAYLVSDDIPKDIFIHSSKTNRGLHLDSVLIEIITGVNRPIEGRVIEILKRFKTEFVGTIQVSDRFAFLVPDSKKMVSDIFIPLSELNGGIDGQKVIAELTHWNDFAKNPNGRVIKILGNAGDNDVEINSILHEYDLPYGFNEDVEAESNAIPIEIPQSEIGKRRDMRNVLTFTIDPDTAKDFDDALSVEWVDGKMQVGVHIADVSHYVRPDTDLDKEALKRGTSVYLVDRVVPMLPERLSNGVCSLRPHEDKLCFSAVFTLDHNGHVLNEWFGRTVIHSDMRFTYEEAQRIIEHGQFIPYLATNTWETPMKDLEDAVKALDKTAKKMRAQRHKRGSISFDKHEVKFDLDENGKPIGIKFKIQKDSNKLIEEYMLLANRHVAKYLKKRGVCVNRAHDEPDPTKLQSLKEFIATLGYDIKTNTPEEITRTLNQLLMDVRGTSEENMITNLVVRTMQKAFYTTDNIGHYGLGFKNYSHFTSPIRRYPDILTHRILSRVIEGKEPMKISKLEARCKHCSEREIKAQKASRDSVKYKQCEYMADKIGKVYSGIITSIMEYGVFVEITETGCDGLVKMSEIGGDTYRADLQNHCVVGLNTGEKLSLGDDINIVVKSVDIEKKNIDLTLIRLGDNFMNVKLNQNEPTTYSLGDLPSFRKLK